MNGKGNGPGASFANGNGPGAAVTDAGFSLRPGSHWDMVGVVVDPMYA